MIEMTVLNKQRLTDHIIELELQAPEDFNYVAGQYVMLGFSSAKTDDDLKPFSIANAPNDKNTLIIQIRKTNQDVWMTQLFAIDTGATLKVKGPNDQYPTISSLETSEDTPIFLIAGGTGFSPMYSLLEAFLAEGHANPIRLYWGGRQPEELYHHDNMLALAEKHANLTYVPVISEDAPDWQGLTGLVHLAAEKDFQLLSDKEKKLTHIFLCGPWPMREAAIKDFDAAGLVEGHFH